jgi:hypothetical protein
MNLPGRLLRLERVCQSTGPHIGAVLIENGRITRILTCGQWQAAPDGISLEQLPPPVKAYSGFDPNLA